jgi:hypothetical protein
MKGGVQMNTTPNKPSSLYLRVVRLLKQRGLR